MKTIIATILALSTINAFSASIPLLETQSFSSGRADGSFGINEEMGRAWVELSVDTGYSGDDSSSSTDSRVQVEGMSLVGGQVVLNKDGSQIVCANVRPVGIFHYHVARATGNCQFRTQVVKEIQDDGFDTKRVSVLKVSLETK
jgi:hypothetical protein